MGNEFGAVDFQPHLIPRMVFEKVIDLAATAATETVIIAGGYHPKMRLRYAHQIVVDAAIASDATTGALNLVHGSEEVIAAAAVTDLDAIGTLDELTIVDQYKDVGAADQIAMNVDVEATDGTGVFAKVLVHLEYELVE